ncbi:enhanced intracellular survival protein Eis [Peribacillus sp. SCS-37]|uniref:GNAT family N-acetyltransferase n=1 Tax=Paraperibacillus esterisolvens TaxID=3115296 RepID=UPI0039067EEB
MHEIVKLDGARSREALDLSMYAFQYKVEERDLAEKIKSYENQDIYGIFALDELAAKMHLRSFEIWLQGNKVKMGGIASVATYPEHRRTGMVDALLKKGLQEMKENGQVISYLHPFKISFYRRYGWEIFSDVKKVEIPAQELKPLSAVPGSIKRFEKGGLSAAGRIYEKYALKFGGMLVRSREWWEKSVLGNYTMAIYYDSESEPQGYAIYKAGGRHLEVNEWVNLNHEARQGLWNFFCQHDSMVKKRASLFLKMIHFRILLPTRGLRQSFIRILWHG